MKITIVNTYDQAGGAARAAYRLHKGLLEANQNSTLYSLYKHSNDIQVRNYQAPISFQARASRFLKRKWLQHKYSYYKKTRPAGLEIFSSDLTSFDNSIIDQLPESEIINLHWISGFIDIAQLLEKTTQPIVWTLHDMNPFTGGCHYNNGCDKYKESCFSCPQLGSIKKRDLSKEVWTRKYKILESIPSKRLHIVSPSKWLAEEASKSTLFKKFPVSVISNGLDTNTFRPRNTEGLREALGIPKHCKILIFSADNIYNNRKGLKILLDALEILSKNKLPIFLITLGHGKIKDLPYPFISLGNVEHDGLMSLYYSLADIFIIPSLEDNLPNTILEAMACATPVVGFEIGGIPDMVKSGESGLLSKYCNANALASNIEQLLSDSSFLEKASHNAFHTIQENFTAKIQSQRYLFIYQQSILSNS